jgi:phosphohistidine phosphatase
MRVYLVRHAHAVEAEEDAERPLSVRGERQARALADFLGRAKAFEPSVIWHSSLVRSRQTAEILAQRLQLAAPLTLMPDLQPEDDPRAVARRLKATAVESVAVFGHEPHLSALASLLVTGRTETPAFVMKKCAALALEGAGVTWMVRWHVSPELLG